MCWVLLGHFFLCQSTEGTVTRRWHQANWMMLVLVFSMDTSVLMHVKSPRVLQQLLSQCQCGHAAAHAHPPPPAKSFLCFLIEKVYFAVSAICVGDTAVLEGQWEFITPDFLKLPTITIYKVVYIGLQQLFVFRYQLYFFLKCKGQLVQLAFVAHAPVKSDCKVNTSVPSSV